MTNEITKVAYKNAREDESKSTTLAQTDETSMQKMEIQKEKYMSPQKKINYWWTQIIITINV